MGPDSHWQELLHTLRTVSTEEEQVRLIDGMLARRRPATLGFVNAHVMNLAHRDPVLARTLRDKSHLLRDGIGLAVLLMLLGRPPGLNMNGTDLIPKIVQRHGGRRVALFGTREPYLSRAVEAIRTQAGIAAENLIAADGFQADEHYVELAQAFSPGLVVLGMGTPKQERIGQLLARRLPAPCLIISGGAVLDFYAGRFPRAPAWLRASGFEWAFRLAFEPRRLFARYVIGNPRFIARALRHALWAWGNRSAGAWQHGPMTEIRLVTSDDGADGPPVGAPHDA